MTAISISLPNKLASQSKHIASELGLSRSEFIRMAITHEIERTKKEMQLNSVISAFKRMKKSDEYRREAEQLDTAFDDELGNDIDDWWE